MTRQEINACVGKTFQIRGARHMCIAAGNDALMLLQLCERDEPLFKLGDPVQYVVAKHPEWYNGELIWAQGAYFTLLQYRGSNASSVDALLDAALDLSDNPLYIAMVSDDAGIRCAGVYTQQRDAEHKVLYEKESKDTAL